MPFHFKAMLAIAIISSAGAWAGGKAVSGNASPEFRPAVTLTNWAQVR